jgi:ERCC4-related helicase
LQKFRNSETNILISTNIIEEGVDIPSCNMIIRFTKPPNFGSYTQSKGRARSLNSVYYLLSDEKIIDEFLGELENFIEIENVTKKCFDKFKANKSKIFFKFKDIEEQFLQQNNIEYDCDSVNDIERLNKLIPPYRKGSAEITCHTAINIVNR